MFSEHTYKYCSIVTSLLQNNVTVAEIADIIEDIDRFAGFSSIEWKQGVIKTLDMN